jgi:hypothetical protein
MHTQLKKLYAGGLVACALSTLVPVAEAYPTTRVRTGSRYGYYYGRPSWGQRHPVLKGTAVGGALGAGIGAVGGAIAGRGRAGRGALAGLGAGAGIGALQTHPRMRRHPIIRRVGQGTLAGLGVGITARKRGAAWKGAGIGALVGGGLGILERM